MHDLRVVIRKAQGRNEQPSAVVFDGRTLKSTPESGDRAGFDGHKKTKGRKVHMAVDTLVKNQRMMQRKTVSTCS